MRAEHADRLARLHQQRLVVGERLEGADDRVVRLPAAGRLAGAAIDDEVLRTLGHLGVEVVHQHAHRRLGLPRAGGDGGSASSANGGTVHVSSPSSSVEEGAGAYELRGGLDVGCEVAIGSGAFDLRPQQRDRSSRGRPGLERCAEVDAASSRVDLDRQHSGQQVNGSAQLAGGGPAHRHVVLLHRARRDRVDAGRRREPLELRHHRRLCVLRDHVARVDARIVGEERRQPLAARRIEEPVRTTLAHAGDVGDRDRQEVEHVRQRRSVEVAVRLDASVVEHRRVVDRRCELAAGNRGGVIKGVAGSAVHLRGAAQRVRVLHAAVTDAVTGDDRRPGEQRCHVLRRRRLSRVRAQRLQVGGEHAIRTHQPFDAHRGREVGGVEQHPQVVQRKHQHAEHPVGAVDQREPFLLGELDRREPVRRQRLTGGTYDAVVVDLALTHHRERAVRQRRQVAGAAEAAVLADDRGQPGVEHRRIGLGGLDPYAGVARCQRRQAQQHQRAHDLVLDARTRAGGVRSDQALLQLGTKLRLDVPGGQGAEAGRDAIDRGVGGSHLVDDGPRSGDRGTRLRAELDERAFARDSYDILRRDRADSHHNVGHVPWDSTTAARRYGCSDNPVSDTRQSTPARTRPRSGSRTSGR